MAGASLVGDTPAPGRFKPRGDKCRNQGVPEGRLVAAPLHQVNWGRRGLMYAIVYKSDGFPICRPDGRGQPDPVVTWMNEYAAKAFISSKGGDAEFQPVQTRPTTPWTSWQRPWAARSRR